MQLSVAVPRTPTGVNLRRTLICAAVGATVHEAYFCGGLELCFEATDVANLTAQSPSER
jgi:hypothetical protein